MANETVNRYLNIYIQSGEAERVLERLEKKEAALNAEIAKGGRQAEKFKQELAQLQEPLERARKKVAGELNPSLKDTEAGVRRVRNELRSMSSSDAGYNKVVQQFKQGNLELDQQRQKMGFLKSSMKSFWQEAKTVATGVLIGNTIQAAVQSIASGLSNIVSSAAKLSDSLADVQRVTGMTKDEVRQLNSSLSSIDTRTSTAGLREIAIIAGKLGVAKTDILSFTEAVDKLVVALGDELGDADQITTQLGKILNVFDGRVTGDNITRLGNAFVELANSGVASGAFLADFDQRLSGVAKNAGISLGALTGLGAGLEEMGARVESSSTAVQKLLITIASDLSKAAKIAGKPMQEFNQTFASDATEALLQYAEGLTKNKAAFSDVVVGFKDAGEEGSRVIEVLSNMGQNADMLRGRIELGTKAMQETNAINDAFALKNETLGASLDKLGKIMGRVFARSGITTLIQDVVDVTIDLIGPTENATNAFDKLKGEVEALEAKMPPLLNRYDELQAKTNLNTSEQKELDTIIAQVTATVPGAASEFDAYGRIIAINTQRARDFVKEQKNMLAYMNQSAIKQTEDDIRRYQDRLKQMESRRKQIEKTGTFDNLVMEGVSTGGGPLGGGSTSIKQRKATSQEVAAFNSELSQTGILLQGAEANLKRLKGELSQPAPTPTTPPVNSPYNPKTIEKAVDSNKKLNESLKETAKLQEAINKFGQKYENLEGEARELDTLLKEYDELLDKVKDNYTLRLQLHNNFQEAALNISFKYHQKEIEEENKKYEKLRGIIASQQAKGIDTSMAQQSLGNIAQTSNAQTRDVAALHELQIMRSVGQARLKAQNDQLEFEKEQKLKNTHLTENERQLIIEEYNQKIHENNAQFELERAANVVKVAQQAFEIWQSFSDLQSEKENQQLEADRRRSDKKRQILDDQLKAGVMSRLEHDRQVAKIEKDQAKREHELRVKQFRRNQRMQIVSTIMSGAQSTINMLATAPWPVNIVMAALAAATTIAQVAIISKQKPPEYARGGLLHGPSHQENKGMPVTDPRTGQTQAYLEGGESIINKRTMADKKSYTVSGTPSQIASLLNAYHGGVHWEAGATMQPVWHTPQTPMNFSGIRKAYAQGGIYTSTTINNNNNGPAGDVMQNMLVTQQYLTDAVDRLNRKLNEGIKSYTVLSESEAQKQRYDNIVNDATMK